MQAWQILPHVLGHDPPPSAGSCSFRQRAGELLTAPFSSCSFFLLRLGVSEPDYKCVYSKRDTKFLLIHPITCPSPHPQATRGPGEGPAARCLSPNLRCWLRILRHQIARMIRHTKKINLFHWLINTYQMCEGSLWKPSGKLLSPLSVGMLGLTLEEDRLWT